MNAAYTTMPTEREQIIGELYPMARSIALAIHRGLPPGVDADDLVGAATLGLVEAVDRYDPSRNVTIKAYARHRVRGAVMDALRDADWVPRSVRRKARRLESSRERLGERLGRDPTRSEVAEDLGVTPRKLDRMERDSRIRKLMSLDARSDDEGGAPLSERISDDSDFLALWEEEELRQLVLEAVEELPPRERTAVGLYYFEELTLKEAGRVMGVTESRVCQLCRKAVRRLRRRLAWILD